MLDKVAKFFSRNKSGNIAKNRMQVLLAVDRQKTSFITEEMINNIKEEIMSVISKYLKMDLETFDVKIERSTDNTGRVLSTVVANIPIDI